MSHPTLSTWNRRRFLTRAGALVAAGALGAPAFTARGFDIAPSSAVPGLTSHQTAPAAPLLPQVSAVCARLAPAGWRDLLLAVTDGGLDIGAADLAAALAADLPSIDRTAPGFEDFALEGGRGIEPGDPARSLLYHALASPNVFLGADGETLSAFPAPAELEAVENYVYGVQPPSLTDLRARVGGAPLAVVVFALEYRPGRESVHEQHADFCFARTGHARLGTTPEMYDAQRREFLPADTDDPFAFVAQPARYAPFIAAQLAPDPETFGPLRAEPSDEGRWFWAPLHKLFSGPECLQDYDLTVSLTTGHINEKLRRFHLQMNNAGFYTGWDEPDISQYPFVIRDETLAAFATDPAYGSGWVLPPPHPLVEAAEYNGKPLTYFFSQDLANSPDTSFYSSLQLLPAAPFSPLGPGRTQSLPENIAIADPAVAGYRTSINPDIGRSSPEYLNVRQVIDTDGNDINLNDTPGVTESIAEGNFWARHFIDYAADGWVSARVVALDEAIPTRVPAYSTVCPPSFYPYANQRGLTEWAETGAPEEFRAGIWAIPPRPLSDRRMAANVHLQAGFSIDDDTVTAVVSLPRAAFPERSGDPTTQVRRHLTLPDGAAGLFDPGWEISQDRTTDHKFFFASYGLGTPFIEDAKLCATLSTFWPGVSPDSAREFPPDKSDADIFQTWPTIAPMTDEEMGIVEVAGLGFMGWDGVRGPHRETVDGEAWVNYPDLAQTDYLETVDRFTAALTSRVDLDVYIARVLAMAQVYWALGIRWEDFGDQFGIAEALDRFQAAKGEWNVLSFRAVSEDVPDADLTAAEAATGETLQAGAYRFELFSPNGETQRPDDVRRQLVGIEEEALAYTDLATLLLRRGDTWEAFQPPA
ncbi:MAG: hypothetical protein QM692_19870 [Thermomicrobiales bacterium]